MDFNQLLNPEDVTDQFTPEDIADAKTVSAVATLPFLFWIPLVAKQSSAFGKHYANQGLLLTCLDAALGVAASIVAAILGIIPILGGILGAVISGAASLISLAAWLILFVNVLQGKAVKLPVVGDLFVAFK